MKTSKNGLKFLKDHEGYVSTAYLDSGGVATIGTGFTMRSPAVRSALAKLGITKLVRGKTKITKEQNEAILAEVLEKEFEPAVNNKLPKDRIVKQHMFDAMVSAVYNLGPGFMGWRWIVPWRDQGNIGSSAAIWRNNYNTDNGKKVTGLVRRRKEEANLFEKGVYPGSVVVEEDKRDPTVVEAQEMLNKLGIPVDVDGLISPKTKKAILVYQMAHPDLKDDGILGRATLTQLRKDVAALGVIAKNTAVGGGGVGALSGVGAALAGWPWPYIVVGVVIIAGVYFGWKYRDVLGRKFNSLLGRNVEVK